MLRFVRKKAIGPKFNATGMLASLLPCALASVYLSSCSVLLLLSVQPELAALDQVNVLARLSLAEFTAGRLEKRAPSTETSGGIRNEMGSLWLPIRLEQNFAHHCTKPASSCQSFCNDDFPSVLTA